MAERSPAEYGAMLAQAATVLLGDPTSKHGDKVRYGRKGSLSLNVAGDRGGQWYDFEAGKGGGLVAFVQTHVVTVGDPHQAWEWLESQGIAPRNTPKRHYSTSRPYPNTDSLPGKRSQAGQTGPPKKKVPSNQDTTNIKTARALAEASQPATDTIAATYLVARKAWPPAVLGYELPDAVRWIPSRRMPSNLPAPVNAAGASAYLLADSQGQTQALELEALDADGQRLPDRWRRTCGPKTGATFQLDREGAQKLVIVEGPATALAVWWLVPGASVWATGGTAGLANLDPGTIPDDVNLVRLYPDADHESRENAKTTQRTTWPKTFAAWQTSGWVCTTAADRFRTRPSWRP